MSVIPLDAWRSDSVTWSIVASAIRRRVVSGRALKPSIVLLNPAYICVLLVWRPVKAGRGHADGGSAPRARHVRIPSQLDYFSSFLIFLRALRRSAPKRREEPFCCATYYAHQLKATVHNRSR